MEKGIKVEFNDLATEFLLGSFNTESVYCTLKIRKKEIFQRSRIRASRAIFQMSRVFANGLGD